MSKRQYLEPKERAIAEGVETPIRITEGGTTYLLYRQDEPFGVDRYSYNRLFDYAKLLEKELEELEEAFPPTVS